MSQVEYAPQWKCRIAVGTPEVMAAMIGCQIGAVHRLQDSECMSCAVGTVGSCAAYLHRVDGGGDGGHGRVCAPAGHRAAHSGAVQPAAVWGLPRQPAGPPQCLQLRVKHADYCQVWGWHNMLALVSAYKHKTCSLCTLIVLRGLMDQGAMLPWIM